MAEPLHYTEYDTRLAAYAVIVRDGQLLLALWNEDVDRKRWTLPGGGVDLYETPEEGAVREVGEETGYAVELTGLLGIETDVIPPEGRMRETDRTFKAVRVFYGARVVGGELTHEVGGTTDEARWFPLDDVPGLARVSMVDTGLRLLSERSC
ncbi:NUDIX hydrolase [Nocardioides sp. KR10-350]|uniref:NUDIX hydrolase n=1 Tax=Nocardioides cheoyonin TaxID=3156615 RepID=UPI0032B3EBC9